MREIEPRSLAKPKTTEQLQALEGRLQTHIGTQRLRVERVRSFQPETILDRLNHGKNIAKANAAESTITNWLEPRLAFVTEEVNKGAIEIAEAYQQEKSDAQKALGDLERTAQRTAAFTRTSVDTFMEPYRQLIGDLDKRPLNNALLKRGLDLIEKRKQITEPEADTAPEEDQDSDVQKRSEKREKAYTITFPDGKTIQTNSLASKLLIEALMKKPLTVNEQNTVVNGEGFELSSSHARNLLTRTNQILEAVGKTIVQPNPATGAERYNGVQRPYVILERETKIPTITIDRGTGEVSIDGRKINIVNPVTKSIFFALTEAAAGDVLSSALLEIVKEAGYTGNRVTDHIKQLRTLLKDDHAHPQIITTYGPTNKASYGLNAEIEFTGKTDKGDKDKAAKKTEGDEGDKEGRTTRKNPGKVTYAERSTIPERLNALEALVADPNISKDAIVALIGTNTDGEPITNLSRIRRSLIAAANLIAVKNYDHIATATDEEKAIFAKITQGMDTTDQKAARKAIVERIDQWFNTQRNPTEIKTANEVETAEPEVQTPVEKLQAEITRLEAQLVEVRALIEQGALEESFFAETEVIIEDKRKELEALTKLASGDESTETPDIPAEPATAYDLKTELSAIVADLETKNKEKKSWDFHDLIIRYGTSSDQIKELVRRGLVINGWGGSVSERMTFSKADAALIGYLLSQENVTLAQANVARKEIAQIFQEKEAGSN